MGIISQQNRNARKEAINRYTTDIVVTDLTFLNPKGTSEVPNQPQSQRQKSNNENDLPF